jgi:hypothetical protein
MMLVQAKVIVTESHADFESLLKKLGDLASADPEKYEEALSTQFVTIDSSDFLIVEEMYDTSIKPPLSSAKNNIGCHFFSIMNQLGLYPEEANTEEAEIVKEQ